MNSARADKTIFEEQSLAAFLKKKDRLAFEYLYKHYSPALLGVLLRYVPGEDTANDLLQDVFVKIWKNIESYQAERGRLYTWMLNIARNTAIDFLRSKQSGRENINQPMVNEGKQYENINHITPQTDYIGLRLMVNNLVEEHSAVLEYVYYKAYTHEEASRVLNLPLGTVKSRVRAAIRELRKVFSQ